MSAEAEGGVGGEGLGTRWTRPPDRHRPLLGRPFSPNALLNKAVSNVISSLIYGRRFEYEDPRFLKLLDLMEEGLKEESGLLRQVGESCAPPPPPLGT